MTPLGLGFSTQRSPEEFRGSLQLSFRPPSLSARARADRVSRVAPGGCSAGVDGTGPPAAAVCVAESRAAESAAVVGEAGAVEGSWSRAEPREK